jgi:hypothetical protein
MDDEPRDLTRALRQIIPRLSRKHRHFLYRVALRLRQKEQLIKRPVLKARLLTVDRTRWGSH